MNFHIDADSETAVHQFLDENPNWNPGDVPGLIDVVSDEVELDYAVAASPSVLANFEIDSTGALVGKP